MHVNLYDNNLNDSHDYSANFFLNGATPKESNKIR